MNNPFQVVRDFEAAVCEYTGAKYCVTTNSCTMALLLAVVYSPYPPYVHGQIKRVTLDDGRWECVEIPKRTYVSVPMSIIHAHCWPIFRDEEWLGEYELKPWRIWDSARKFTSGMFRMGEIQCVSFHQSKILGDSQGGAILHDDPVTDAIYRRARFDGRTEYIAPKDDDFTVLGYHCYMSPDVASRLLWKLSRLPAHNDPLPNDDYPDLSKFPLFDCGVEPK